ncbi:AarF/UbiB family protein [Psychrobacter sp. HD31]|uniref:ABC1 kinase family protein n=1 Tax=Psychrobacter sp. HD31 TaxID=3112003 RepID=UPI003DA46252
MKQSNNFSNRLVNLSNQLKKQFKTPLNAANRVGKTAKVAGKSAIRIAKGEKPNPKMLRESFEEMGTTYIKIGQFIASMPSVFPKEYVQEFQGCLDQTTPLPYSYIEQVLTQELTKNQPLTAIFKHIDLEPIASASIAQVHAAVLHDGRKVVLKVQKPDVKTIIETDLGMLHGISRVLETILPSIKIASIAPIIDEIRAQMTAETNFISEAQNIADFHEFLHNSYIDSVTAPMVIKELTTKRVLTMTHLDGVSMVDIDAMAEYCDDPAQVMASTLNTWFASITGAKSFHADLHAGNLMLLKNGQVAFIDFGIVGHIKPESWQAVFALMNAIQAEDYAQIADAMIEVGMTKVRHKVNKEQLTLDIESVINMVKQNQEQIQIQLNESMSQIDPTNLKSSIKNMQQPMDEINQLLLELMEVAKKHGIQFPRDFVLLIKQMLYFDRFVQVLAPGMDVFHSEAIDMVQ